MVDSLQELVIALFNGRLPSPTSLYATYGLVTIRASDNRQNSVAKDRF